MRTSMPTSPWCLLGSTGTKNSTPWRIFNGAYLNCFFKKTFAHMKRREKLWSMIAFMIGIMALSEICETLDDTLQKILIDVKWLCKLVGNIGSSKKGFSNFFKWFSKVHLPNIDPEETSLRRAPRTSAFKRNRRTWSSSSPAAGETERHWRLDRNLKTITVTSSSFLFLQVSASKTWIRSTGKNVEPNKVVLMWFWGQITIVYYVHKHPNLLTDWRTKHWMSDANYRSQFWYLPACVAAEVARAPPPPGNGETKTCLSMPWHRCQSMSRIPSTSTAKRTASWENMLRPCVPSSVLTHLATRFHKTF